MTDDKLLAELKAIKLPAPDWFSFPIDEQIQYQIDIAKKEYPDRTAIMCFVYDPSKVPAITRTVVEI